MFYSTYRVHIYGWTRINVIAKTEAKSRNKIDYSPNDVFSKAIKNSNRDLILANKKNLALGEIE